MILLVEHRLSSSTSGQKQLTTSQDHLKSVVFGRKLPVNFFFHVYLCLRALVLPEESQG